MTDAIIVVGMHRSGTSLAAELVCRWGAYGSERDLVAPSQWNPRGYWEFAPLVRFNDRLLRAVGSKWNVPPADDGARVLSRLARQGAYRDEGLRLLDHMRSAGRTWFWKDPRLSILLPFWRRLWAEAAYVILVRDPMDIALSLRARDHIPVSASLLLWRRYILDILRWTEPAPAKIFVEYDALLDSGADECARLDRFLRSQCRPGGKASPPDVLRNMRGAIDPALRRHRNKSTQTFATAPQRDLFDTLRSLTKRRRPPAEPNLAGYGLDPGWREYLIVLDTLRELSLATAGRRQQKLFATLPPAYRGIFGG